MDNKKTDKGMKKSGKYWITKTRYCTRVVSK